MRPRLSLNRSRLLITHVCTLLFLLFPASLCAQYTTVSATVVDPNGIPYGGGSVVADLVPIGATPPTLNGRGFSAHLGPAALDTTGSFAMAMADNNVVSPAGTQWRFNVCQTPGVAPPFGFGSQCFPATLTITGASQNISAQLNALAPPLARGTTSIANPGRIGSDYFPGTASGLVTPPSGIPTVGTSSTGGSIAAGTYYFCVTYVNANGETPCSPSKSATLAGATSSIVVVAETDTNWQSGAFGEHMYSSNDNVNFFLQTPVVVNSAFLTDPQTHYIKMGFGTQKMYPTLTFSGTQAPVSNTAVIDPLQVALNASRRPSDGTPFGTLRVPALQVSPFGHLLTTPLIAVRADHILGYGGANGIGGVQSRILGSASWNNEKLGVVMNFGGEADIEEVSLIGQSSNVLMTLAGVGYQAGSGGPTVTRNVYLVAPQPAQNGMQLIAFKRSAASSRVNGSGTGAALLAVPPAAGITSATTSVMSLTAGNALACTVRWGGGASQTITSVSNLAGDTFANTTKYTFSAFDAMETFYVLSSAGNANDQFTVNFNQPAFFVAVACDQHTNLNAVDVTAQGVSTGSSITSAAFTTTNANDLLYAAMDATFSPATLAWAPGTGYTLGQAAVGGTIGTQYQSVSGIQTNVTASASFTPSLNLMAYVGVGILFDIYFENASMTGGVYDVEFRNASGGEIHFNGGRWDASGEGFMRMLPGYVDPDSGTNSCGAGGFCAALSDVRVAGIRTEGGHGILWDVRNLGLTLDSLVIADTAIRSGTDSILRMGCTVEGAASGGSGQLTLINTNPGSSANARVGTFFFNDGTCNAGQILLHGHASPGLGQSSGSNVGLDLNNQSGIYITYMDGATEFTMNPNASGNHATVAINVPDNTIVTGGGGGSPIAGQGGQWFELAGRLVLSNFFSSSQWKRSQRLSTMVGANQFGESDNIYGYNIYASDDVTPVFGVKTNGFGTFRGNARIQATGGGAPQFFIGPSSSTAAGGSISLINAGSVFMRNFANSADIRLLAGDASDRAIVGDAPGVCLSTSTNCAPIKGNLSATATLNFASITAPNCAADLTITVTGAADGDPVFLGPPNGSVPAGVQFFAWVSAANTVSVRACAFTGTPDPASGTFRVAVMKF